MNVPLVQAFDLQVAWRKETYSDFEGERCLSRYAFSTRVADGILFRGSSQEKPLESPNLSHTMNELTASRVNTRWDWPVINMSILQQLQLD